MANVSGIYLLETASGQLVAAELRDAIEAPQLEDWQKHWRPTLFDALRALQEKGVSARDWPQGWRWDWNDKIASVEGLLAYRGFSVVAAGVTQGLAQVELTRTARAPGQEGKPLVYVNYLETAPWNRRDLGFRPTYRGVGSALLAAAVSLSMDEDFKGRIGLHSLHQADEFYVRKGMTSLGPDPKLTYFEMDAERARAFLEEE